MTPQNPPKVFGLKKTQKAFDTYQTMAFPARPSEFFALEMAGECGELCNLEKKIWRDPSAIIDMDKLSDEAADVLIALVNYCNARGIDLESAVNHKLVTIESRRVLGQMGPVKS